jgi:hypothetical protein
MRLIEPLKTEPQVGQHPLVPFCRVGGSEFRTRFEPSVPLYGELGALGRDATHAAIVNPERPIVRVDELDERFAACLGRLHMASGGVPVRLLGNV